MNLSYLHIKKYKLIIAIYLLFLFLFFILFIKNDNYIKNPKLRFSADTVTYYKLANRSLEVQHLVRLKSNLLGPIIIINLTRNNLLLAFLLNVFLFIISLKVFFEAYSNSLFNREKFIFYLLINPLLFVSLLMVNKELFCLVSILFFLSYLKENKKKYLIIALIFAIFTRWQHLFVFLVFFMLQSPLYIFKGKNRITILLMILFINTFFGMFFSTLSNIGSPDTLEMQRQKTGWLIQLISFCENNYLYFLVLPLKIMLNLFGNFFRAVLVLNPSYVLGDVYNNFFIIGHQIAFVYIGFMMFKKKKLNLSNDIYFLSIIFCILYSLTRMIQYRYFYVVYLLWIYILSCGSEKKYEKEINDISLHGHL
jgi:hypothetical protein